MMKVAISIPLPTAAKSARHVAAGRAGGQAPHVHRWTGMCPACLIFHDSTDLTSAFEAGMEAAKVQEMCTQLEW